jgi:predicted metal-dependent phosphotriesterase family hydrolase
LALYRKRQRMNGRVPDQTLIPQLLILPNERFSLEAVELLSSLGVDFRAIEVSPADYTPPRDVPKLMTDSGMYVGIDSIKRIAQNELVGSH